MKTLLIGIIVLGVLLVGGDAAARLVAEHKVAAELQSSFDLNVRPTVSIDGWPFLIHLVDGKFSKVTASADEVGKGGVTFSRISVSLRNVHFTFPKALTGGHGTFRASSGTGTAELTGGDLTAALRDHGIPATVAFSGGHMTLSSSSTGVAIEAPLNFSGASLQLGPVHGGAATIGPFRLELPTAVDGFNYASAHIVDDKVVLTLGIRDKQFSF
ncbi:MAG: DUF2993 domain-containing protein [Actinomycetota bacterium]